MSRLILIALLLAATGCQREAQESGRAGDVQIEKLFTHDGCTAYRFYDGRTVHFVRCGARTETTWNRSCGKSCTRTESVTATEDYP